eukprot:scaffold3365_cov79-Skeletonema_marinoi.AAC.1
MSGWCSSSFDELASQARGISNTTDKYESQLSWLSGIGQKAFFGFSPDTTEDPDSYHLFTRAIFVLLLLHASPSLFSTITTIILMNNHFTTGSSTMANAGQPPPSESPAMDTNMNTNTADAASAPPATAPSSGLDLLFAASQ